MRDLDLDAIESRAREATPSPWRAEPYKYRGTLPDDDDWVVWMGPQKESDSTILTAGDAAFIAHARDDVPDMAAKLRETRKQLDECCKYAKHWRERAEKALGFRKAHEPSRLARTIARNRRLMEATDLRIIRTKTTEPNHWTAFARRYERKRLDTKLTERLVEVCCV